MLFPWGLKLTEDLAFMTAMLILDSLFVTIQWEPRFANTPENTDIYCNADTVCGPERILRLLNNPLK